MKFKIEIESSDETIKEEDLKNDVIDYLGIIYDILDVKVEKMED